MNQKEIRYYIAPNGKSPFKKWLNKVKDPAIKARILHRLDRVSLGNYGDYKPIADGIYELRLVFGSGYRIYFTEYESVTVILLLGGDKSTQSADIKKAKKYYDELKERIA